MREDGWPALVVLAGAVWFLDQVVAGPTWTAWLVGAAVVLGQGALGARVRARRPVGAWRPWPFWLGRLGATTVVVTAIPVVLGAPGGAYAVVLGASVGPIATMPAFALRPRVGPPAWTVTGPRPGTRPARRR